MVIFVMLILQVDSFLLWLLKESNIPNIAILIADSPEYFFINSL
jgi:hypothetical protein